MRLTSLLLFTLTFTSSVQADWQPLLEKPEYEVLERGILLRDRDHALSITALSPEILRIRYTPKAAPDEDPSFAVIQRDFPGPGPEIVRKTRYSELRTSALRLRVSHEPLRLEFFDAAGNSLDADDGEQGMARAGESFRVAKRLRDDEQVYGFGEKTGRLNKRGMGLGGYQYTMWNTDTYGYDSSVDPIYVSVPFYLVLRGGRAHGLFLDNTHRSHFDIGRESRSRLSFGAEGGELDYYFIAGPDPKDVLRRYADLTGRMPLPPRWALGYHQSRWSYYPESRVRKLAEDFRAKKIPADTLWLDIDYQDGFKPFTWDHEQFPAPKKLIADLKALGFHLVTIVDPHPKKELGYPVYDQGLAGNHFVRNPDGSLFEGPVWPSGAKKNPGNSVFPDFTRSATREWWGALHKEFLELGVAGIWNDMNEPAVWIPPANTMPMDLRHDNDGRPTDQREIHNVYGMLHSRATYEGLARLLPNARPFVLTRASFAGGQRYAAVWPGDNTADWSSLRQSLPMLMGLGLSGMPFVGADIGGFSGYPSAELYTRWLQAAVFSPFMRSHTEQATPDQDPMAFGPEHEAVNRRAIELRYRLLPQIYKEMEAASRSGVPALRPLFLEFPADKETWSRDDQYLFGSDLLVAPVLREAVTEREVYLPPGTWYDYASGERLEGGHHKRRVTLDSLPIFARAGAFVFEQPVVQHVGEMPGKALEVRIFPAERSEGEFYEDDGESLAYRRGEYARRVFRQERSAGGLRLHIGMTAGSYPATARPLVLKLMAQPPAAQVLLDGKRLPSLREGQWQAADRGWMLRAGELWIKFPDGANVAKLVVEP
ncbi:MAG: DUF5110 domain-containing protein [Gammaproteobacteria bacterium]|nr:DUF5110 domain-containing protein [Gammaproteobacteria bacterium]